MDTKILRVPVNSPTLEPHTTANCFLIGNEQESLLIDTGFNHAKTRYELENVIQKNNLKTPKTIILTHSHPDHASGVCQLMDWEPIIYCHPNEKESILKTIPRESTLSLLHDNTKITVANIEISILLAPGHTPGQLNLYIPSKELLISGDNIVGTGTTWIGPPEGNMTEYLQTLDRLRSLKLKKIGPGHGEWVESPYEQIDFVIKRRRSRENQIISLLKEHQSLTSFELMKKIYENNIPTSVYGVAQKTIEAHLIKLLEERKVIMQDSVYRINS